MKKDIEVIKIILAVAVAVIALLVRMPSAFLVGLSEEQEEAFTDETGLPYFTDPDSYYHIRLVDTMLKTGKMADAVTADGEPWDMHSFYPDGRSAAYEPGIVRLTIALWKVFNLSAPIDISRVEFYLSGFMAMLTALAAFIAGCRINGKISGFVAGVLIGCAPDFVSRTSFGRFDTDIFVVLMNVLLVLFLTETLRASETKKQLVYAIAYVVTAIVYANCWQTRFSMLFAGLTIACGLIFVFIDSLKNTGDLKGKERILSVLKKREIVLLIGAGALILLIIGITMGFSKVADLFSSLTFNMSQEVRDGAMPNMFESISELTRPAIVPEHFADWFRGYVLGAIPTVVTGIGGAFAAAAAVGCLVMLCIGSFGKPKRIYVENLGERECLMYLIILGLWTITGLYLTRLGVRFIEMLTVPVGLLAGIFIGWIPALSGSDNSRRRIAGVIVSVIAITAVVLPDFEGIFIGIRVPSVTDASANAMKSIRENADDPNALIESWWDMGYFYESESGHPCLWDGGSQEPVRAILLSRAFVETDMETSCRILNMLASSGIKAVEMLMDSTDTKTAFETLWEVLPMETEEACAVISEKCDMNEENAVKVEELIHPTESKETYLVLTYTMARQTTMYEFYSDWDFTGTQVSPYSEEADDSSVELSESEKEELEKKRDGYTMWRLFFEVEDNPYFSPVYEYSDSLEGVRVWKVNAI